MLFVLGDGLLHFLGRGEAIELEFGEHQGPVNGDFESTGAGLVGISNYFRVRKHRKNSLLRRIELPMIPSGSTKLNSDLHGC